MAGRNQAITLHIPHYFLEPIPLIFLSFQGLSHQL